MRTKKHAKPASEIEPSLESSTDPRWVDLETGGCHFSDVRLGRRFKTLVEEISDCVGGSIPFACQDWASTKAAYRFFSNPRVSEADILGGHFESTRSRFHAGSGTTLILHDTTEFSYERESARNLGLITRACMGSGRDGRLRHITVRGILMHSSLAVTLDGLPPGLASIKFWTRKNFKGCDALKRKINPTRVPIEEKESYRWLENIRQSTRLLGAPERCVHIGDRESDIYELFCTAREEGTHFLVRTCVDRLAGDGEHTVADEMKATRVKGTHRLQLKTREGEASEAVLKIKYRRIQVLPPIGKKDRYPQLALSVIYAKESGKPKGRDPVEWKLITDLPVDSLSEAIKKLAWYSLRWKIEVFHKILKSGCKAEESKLRTAERMVPLWKETSQAIRNWIKFAELTPHQPLFPNRFGTAMTRTAVQQRLRLYVQSAEKTCPSLRRSRISPHTIRHTTAMHLIQSGVATPVITLWLGHEDPATTHQYIEADLLMKEAAPATKGKAAPLQSVFRTFAVPRQPLIMQSNGVRHA